MPSPERLRIAILTYATQPRGGVVHARALAEALHALGHDSVLFAVERAGNDFETPPRCAYRRIEVATVREETLAFVRRRVAAYVDYFCDTNERFDIYHAHDGISGNALATLARAGRIPGFARTVHHVDDFADSALAALQERSIVAAERCFVVSRLWAATLRARFGIDAAVVPSGVDCERFFPAPRARRIAARRALGCGGPLFVTVGGIEARKNTLATLEAFALVRATLPRARLIIAGGASVLEHGAYRRAFELRRAELGLGAGGDGIAVLGVCSDAQIVTLFHAADAFVFPSLVEGFGLVLLEALACGTPVVAAATAPFTEYLSARSALLVDPHSPPAIAAAMRRVLEPSVARRLRARGPGFARAYTWRASALAHARLYRRAYEKAG